MNGKSFILLLATFVALFLLLGVLNTSNAASVDVVSDFDNNTLTTVEMSDSQSKTIWGFENLAEVQTKTGGDMKNTHIETDEGLWNYEYMTLNGQIMDRNDRVYGKNGNQILYAHYTLTPYGYADITIIDDVGNSGGYVNYPAMKNIGDSVTHTFKPFTDYDDIHWEPFFIQDMDTKQVYQPYDNFTVTYSDCIANNGTIHKVFKYIYGYYPDYNANFISINKETGEIFDNITITINRQNWSAFYTLLDAPVVKGKVLDFIYIIEDGLYNYHEGDNYQVDYDMALSEGNNITRHFEYNYKQGSYANVTVNYIFNIDNELNNTIFHSEYYPMLVVGDEVIGGYVDYHPEVAGYDFTYVTFQEIITNSVKGMYPGSNVRDEGGFWIYEVNETGDIDLNFIYNYVPIKVDPIPEPTPIPTPAHGNDTDNNGTVPVNPTPVPIIPVDNNVVNNNTNSNNTSNVTAKAVSSDSNVVTMPVTGENPLIAIVVLIVFILVFVVGYFVDNRRNED